MTHRQPLRRPKDEAGRKDAARPPDGDTAMEVEPPAGSKGTRLTAQAAIAGEAVKPVPPVKVVAGGGRSREGSLSGRPFILEVTK